MSKPFDLNVVDKDKAKLLNVPEPILASRNRWRGGQDLYNRFLFYEKAEGILLHIVPVKYVDSIGKFIEKINIDNTGAKKPVPLAGGLLEPKRMVVELNDVMPPEHFWQLLARSFGANQPYKPKLEDFRDAQIYMDQPLGTIESKCRTYGLSIPLEF